MSKKNKLVASLSASPSVSGGVIVTKKWFWYSVVAIFAVTLLVYLPSLSNQFTNWDDEKYVVDNLIIRNFSVEKYFTVFTIGLYTPLTTLSYALDYHFWGLDAWGYHFTSLLLHLANTFLVILFIKKFSTDTFLALLVGLLFAIHPTHVEPVAWVSSRKDLLYSFFSLLSFVAYLTYREKKSWLNYALAFVFMLMACLSKPTALGIPLLFLAIDYLKEQKIALSFIWDKIPFLILSAIILAVGVYGIRTLAINIAPETGYSIWQLVCMASYGFVFYFYKALLPVRLSNFHIYPFPNGDMPGEYVLAPFLLAAIIFVFIKFRKYIPAWQAGLLLFFVLLLPTYRFYPSGYPIVAERYFYLSSIGLFFILASFIKNLFITKLGTVNVAAVTVFTLICLVYSFGSAARSKVWKNSLTLWGNAIKTYPKLYFAYESRGKYYMKTGNRQLAKADFQKSLELQPNNADLLNTYGNMLFEDGEMDKGLQFLNQCLLLDSTNFTYYYNRANILKAKNQFEASIKDYDKCLGMDSLLAQAFNNRGVAKIFVGDTLGAYKDFNKAVALNPYDAMFEDNRKRAGVLVK